MNPFFIIGTERSGTNLLRLILNSHSNITIPHPPHILKNFFNLEPLYGDLNNSRILKTLINDIVKTIELHPYPWGMTIDKEKILNNIKEKNLICIFFAIHEQYLENSGKKMWGCKSTFMINHLALIKQYYPKAKFIYMIRDGRDVAVSARKTIFNHYSIYHTAKLWKKEQQTGIYWLNKLPKEDIHPVKYEDFVSDPEVSLKNICSFLNEMYEVEMLNFFKTKEAKKSSNISAAWKNTANPVMSNNFGKFKAKLAEREVNLFEAMAAPELDYFSYELASPFYVSEGIRARGIRFRMIYLLEEVFLKFKVQIKYFFSDKNNFLRYKKFWFLKLIKIIR